MATQITTEKPLPEFRRVIHGRTFSSMWAPPGTALEPMDQTEEEERAQIARDWRIVDMIVLVAGLLTIAAVSCLGSLI